MIFDAVYHMTYTNLNVMTTYIHNSYKWTPLVLLYYSIVIALLSLATKPQHVELLVVASRGIS